MMCDYALAPFDRRFREMDKKWGCDKLPELVSAETAAKWGSTMEKLNAKKFAKSTPLRITGCW